MALNLPARDPDNLREPEETARELFFLLRTSFYRELARLLRMRTDMSLPDLITVLETTGKYPRPVLRSIAKKLREGEASFAGAIRDWAPARDAVILNLADKRTCPLESVLDFLVDFPD